MKRDASNMKYDTNQQVRSKIDNILHECVVMFANVGMDTPLDVGSREEAKRLEKEKLDQIKEIDEQFYHDRLYIKRSEEDKEKIEEQKS